MDSLTIRVSRSTHALLRELADKADATMADVVDQALRDYQRRQFWADYHAAYAALQADPAASADFRREVEAWDATCADGLED
jgi:predicted transcriptional regulator